MTVLEAGAVLGAPDPAPLDAMLVSAAAPSVPESLLEQLKSGGRIVLPVGERSRQRLTRVWVHADKRVYEELAPCSYVPLWGDEAWPEGP